MHAKDRVGFDQIFGPFHVLILLMSRSYMLHVVNNKFNSIESKCVQMRNTCPG